MQRIGLIGFGRFGRAWATQLCQRFIVHAYDPVEVSSTTNATLCSLERVLQEKTIFIATPIHAFESIIKTIADDLTEGTTLVDVCSVKIHPVAVMQDYLPHNIGIIATHPLFGPDSINNPSARKIVMHNARDSHRQYAFWQTQFRELGFKIIEMTPDAHDRLMAETQNLTHFIGRILQQMNIKPTELSTLGYEKLLEVTHYTCNDSWDLFYDMQYYNPYAKEVLTEIIAAAESIQGAIKQKT